MHALASLPLPPLPTLLCPATSGCQCVDCDTLKLLHHIKSSPPRTRLDPELLRSAILNRVLNLTPTSQRGSIPFYDAHEVLLQLLDEDCLRHWKGSAACSLLPTVTLSSLLSFSTANTMSCSGCGETFAAVGMTDTVISLALTDARRGARPRLIDCLQHHWLDTDLEWNCRACDHAANQTKRALFNSSPPILCVHLRNILFDRETGARRKLPFTAQPISPLRLSLQSLMTTAAASEGSHDYLLTATICHEGSLDSGHFVAYIKQGDNWYAKDHHGARQVRQEHVLEQQHHILFYALVHHDGAAVEDCSPPTDSNGLALWLDRLSQGDDTSAISRISSNSLSSLADLEGEEAASFLTDGDADLEQGSGRAAPIVDQTWIKERWKFLPPSLPSIPAECKQLYIEAMRGLLLQVEHTHDEWRLRQSPENEDRFAGAWLFFEDCMSALLSQFGTSLMQGDRHVRRVDDSLLRRRLKNFIDLCSSDLFSHSPRAVAARKYLNDRFRLERAEAVSKLKARAENRRERRMSERLQADTITPQQAAQIRNLMQKGRYSDAARIIFEPMSAEAISSETKEALLQLHPQRDEGEDPMPPLPEDAPSPVIDEDTLVYLSEARVDDGRSAGPSGATGHHYYLLFHDTDTVRVLAKLCTCIADGSMPDKVTQVVIAARLIALKKIPAGVRPVAINGFLCRLTGKILVSRISKNAIRSIFGKLQLGLDTAGVDRIVHRLQFLLEEDMHNDRKTSILSVDMRNAFNTRSRPEIAQALYARRELDTLWRYFHSLYSTTGALLLHNDGNLFDSIDSTEGCRQGCVMGSLLFSLSMQQAYMRLQHMVSHISGLDPCEREARVFAFIDDLTLSGHPLTVLKALQTYNQELPKGMEINMGKSVLWVPDDSHLDEECRLLAEELCIKIETGNTKVLGSYVGLQGRAQQQEMDKKWGDDSKIFRAVARLVQAPLQIQHKLLLLRQCLNMRMGFLTRMLPPSVTLHAASQYDYRILQATRQVLQTIEDRDWTEHQDNILRRPQRLGGFGLMSASATRAQAYLSSVLTMIVMDGEGRLPEEGTMMREHLERAWSNIKTELQQHSFIWDEARSHLGMAEDSEASLSDLVESIMLRGEEIAKATEAKMATSHYNRNRRLVMVALDRTGHTVEEGEQEQEEQEEEEQIDVAGLRAPERREPAHVMQRIKLQWTLTHFINDGAFISFLRKVRLDLVALQNEYSNIPRTEARVDAIRDLRLRLHTRATQVGHLIDHCDTTTAIILNVRPSAREYCISDKDMLVFARLRLFLPLIPGHHACPHDHKANKADLHFADAAHVAHLVNKIHQLDCSVAMHKQNRTTRRHDTFAKAVAAILRSTGKTTQLEPRVRDYLNFHSPTQTQLAPTPADPQIATQLLPEGILPLPRPTTTGITPRHTLFLGLPTALEGQEDIDGIQADEIARKDLFADVATHAFVPTLYDITISSLHTPSILSTRINAFTTSASTRPSLFPRHHLLRCEARKKNHYANFLRALPSPLRQPSTSANIFAASGIDFVPLALSAHGNFGPSLLSFISSLATEAAFLVRGNFLRPTFSPHEHRAQKNRHIGLFKARCAVAWLRGTSSMISYEF